MQVSLRDRWIALPLSVNCAKCLLRDPSVVARSIDWCANDRFIVRAEQSMDSANRSTARNTDTMRILHLMSVMQQDRQHGRQYPGLVHE